MSTEHPDDNVELDSEPVVNRDESQPVVSKLETFGWALVRMWGMLFRAMFISLIGIIGYLWLDPQSIGDVPFAELTLNQVLNNMFAGLIAIGCIIWFFSFPDQGDVESLEDNPYVTWGRFGGGVFLVVALVVYWFNK